jgi:hypothetical protein
MAVQYMCVVVENRDDRTDTEQEPGTWIRSPHSATSLLLWASLCAVRIFFHPFLMAPFTSNLDMSSGCLSWMCLLPSCLVCSNFKSPSSSRLLSFFLLHEQPWRAARLPRWERSWLPSHLVALMVCLTCVADFCRPSWLRFRCQGSVYLSR